MNSSLFNIHDFVLLMTAFQCCFFSVMLLWSKKFRRNSGYFLTAFLMANACISLHELIYYGEEFRYTVLDISTNLFFIGSFAYYVDAVLLYFYIKSLIYKDFSLRKADAFHLIPIALYLIYMIGVYYAQNYEIKVVLIRDYTFAYIWHYVTVDAINKGIRIIYLIWCLSLIAKYRSRLKDTRSDIEAIDLTWLKLLVVGFLIVMSSEFVLSLAKVCNIFVTIDITALMYMGLSGYYVAFLLVTSLLFFSAINLSSVESIRQKALTRKAPSQELLNTKYVERIERIMKEDKPYMIPNITFDALAETLDVPPRDLSFTINRHYKINFYEFINLYRIEEAKVILASKDNANRSITDIFLSVGFNSKSVFNTFFKKNIGMTPSEYRTKFCVD
jgi:AraC-like DNA-binding protein